MIEKRKLNWGILITAILLLLFWSMVIFLLSCAPSQKEIDDHYRGMIDSVKYHHTMDSLKNLDIDSLINSILSDTTNQ